jgi:hypothetical protein
MWISTSSGSGSWREPSKLVGVPVERVSSPKSSPSFSSS